MPVRWWIGVSLLFFLCTVLAAGARLVGQSMSAKPTYLDPGDCEQPCWLGVKPGISTREDFAITARTASPYTGYVTDYGDGIAARFEISTYGMLTLGDVVREFGPPDQVSCLGYLYRMGQNGQRIGFRTNAQLYFADGLIAVDAVRDDVLLRLSPDMQVRTIRYYAPGEPVYELGSTIPWHGFASTIKYRACHP